MTRITKQQLEDMAKEIHQIIEKHIPIITQLSYDAVGIPDIKGSSCLDRITLGLTIELIKAGVLVCE